MYYAKYWYYGSDKECVECILKTYSQYYREKDTYNFHERLYCSNHAFLDPNNAYRWNPGEKQSQ